MIHSIESIYSFYIYCALIIFSFRVNMSIKLHSVSFYFHIQIGDHNVSYYRYKYICLALWLGHISPFVKHAFYNTEIVYMRRCTSYTSFILLIILTITSWTHRRHHLRFQRTREKHSETKLWNLNSFHLKKKHPRNDTHMRDHDHPVPKEDIF